MNRPCMKQESGEHIFEIIGFFEGYIIRRCPHCYMVTRELVKVFDHD